MKTIALFAAVAAAAVAVPAAAQDSVEIYFGDLNVASSEGAQALNARIQAGADAVCERPDNRDLKGTLVWQDCKSAAVSSAVEQLASKGISMEGAQVAAN